MSTHGVFAARDLSPQEERSPPSLAVRKASEKTKQRTSDNRFVALHLTGFPVVYGSNKIIDDNKSSPNQNNDWGGSQLLEKLRGSPRGGTAVSPRSKYPSMRTTKSTFDESMTQAVNHFRNLSPKKRADAASDNIVTDATREEMREARKMPYDSLIKSARGPLSTIYRQDFCKNPSQDLFRTIQLPVIETREEKQAREAKRAAAEAKELCPEDSVTPRGATAAAEDLAHVQHAANNERSAGGAGTQPDAPRGATANAAHKRVVVPSPRRVAVGPPPVISNDDFVAVSRSYFTNRHQQLRQINSAFGGVKPWIDM